MRLVWDCCLGLFAFASVCLGCDSLSHRDTPATPEPNPDGGTTRVSKGPPTPLTPENLGGTLYSPGNSSVAWARTFPGQNASAPLLRLGPDGELVALVSILRRPQEHQFYDYWLMRFDGGSGDVLWVKLIDEWTYQLAVDSAGNILIGYTTHLDKLAPDGVLLWSKPISAERSAPRVSLAVDGRDDILLAELDADGATPNVSDDVHGTVTLEKLDSSGNPLWSHTFGDDGTHFDGAHVAVDADGSGFLLSSFVRDPVDFGGGAVSGDAVLSGYDADGNHVFSKVLALNGPLTLQSPLTTDASGNVFVTNESYGRIDLGMGEIFCGGSYVIKLDPQGTILWNTCTAYGELAVTPDGGFITAASIAYTQKVGETECTVAERDSSGTEGALAQYDASGKWLTTSCTTEPSRQFFGRVAPDPGGMFFLGAAFGVGLTLPDGSTLPAVDGGVTEMVAKVSLAK